MDEITEIRQLLDPPQGLRPDTAQAARRRLMRAAAPPARRRHGRMLRVTTAASAAAAAAAAVAVTVTGPGHHQPRSATLTAWTVSRAADGTVTVTIRDFRDPAGLQRNLAAAGIPALVQVTAGQCPYPYQAIPGNASVIGRAVSRDPRTPGSDAVFTIHPGAIPAGTQLDIFFPSAGHRIAKPAPPQAPPTAAASSPSGNGEQAAHPVAIRLIPASQPQCAKPSPASSPS